jgi:4-hydroxybenzoate polyprenyltransferase
VDIHTRLAALVAATHPVPGASVTALVAALLAARGAEGEVLAWATLSTAAGQASVGWSNDYLDRFEDDRVGRREKPLVARTIAPRVVARAAAVAFAAAVALSVPVGLGETAVMGAAVASAWSYNLGLKRTAGSWVPYAVSFGLLPVYVWLATGSVPPAWLVVGAAVLGVAGHLTNVLPDLEGDAVLGRRGLPNRLGPRRSLLAACALLGVGLVVVFVATGAWRDPSGTWVAAAVAAALIGAVLLGVPRGSPRAAFYLTIAAAAAIAAVLILSLPAPSVR